MAFGFDPRLILAQTQTNEPTPNETLRTLADLATHRANLGDMLHKRQRAASLADIYRQHATNQDALPSALLGIGEGDEALQWIAKQAQIRAQELAAQRGLSPEELEARKARAEYELAKAEALKRGGGTQVDPDKRENLRLRNQKLRQDLGGGTGGPPESAVRQWSGRVPKDTLPTLSQLKDMEAIAQHFGGWDKVPGAGFGEGWMPGQTLDPKADEFRRLGLSIIAARRNALFGASLSPGEKASFEQIADMGGKATTAQIANAMRIIKKATEAGAHGALAGAPDDVKGVIFRDLNMPFAPSGTKGGKAPEPAMDAWNDADEKRLQELEGKLKGRK